MIPLDDDPMPPDPMRNEPCGSVVRYPAIVITPKERAFYISMRQGLLIQLGALEDFLGLERSVVPKHLRGDSYARRP